MSRKAVENICHVKFSNKSNDLINAYAIFNNVHVTSKLNETCNDFPISTFA